MASTPGEKTGRGQHIDMALLDTMTGVLANQAMNALFGARPTRMGNAHPNVAPYAVFPVSDGWFILAVGNDSQFRSCCDVLGLAAERDDPRYATNGGRIEHRASLTDAIAAATRQWKRDELLAALEAANVPAGPINTVNQALADPHLVARGMVVESIAADGRRFPGMRAPIRFSDATLAEGSAAPVLGCDDATVTGFSSP